MDTQWPVRVVLFDLDGTLIDSAPDLGAAADSLRAVRGMPPLPAHAYRPVVGAGARGLLGVALGVSPEDDQFAALREEFFIAYEQRMTELTSVFEGIAPLLQALGRQSLLWGIVTNKIGRFARPLVHAFEPLHTARVVIAGDSTAYTKPHPQPLLEAARRIGVQPEHCIYVGDDARDIQAGRAAGMRTAVAAWGYLGIAHGGALADASGWGADKVLNHPGELLHWLQSA